MKIGNTLYLDHQATTPLDSRVLAAMNPYLVESFGNPHSADHALGWTAAQAVESAAAHVAGLIGADPDEIIFTSGATEANNLALLGLARRASGGKRRRILLGATEHKCVLAVGRVLEKELGLGVETLPVDDFGYINLDYLESRMSEDVLAVSLMVVNNEVGTIQDIGAVSQKIGPYGAVFHCDAAQGPCAMNLEGLADQVDLLSLSGHKMYGPKGVGALFIRRALQDRMEPLIYGGGQQKSLRSGTLPTPLCVGMGAAARLLADEDSAGEREKLARLRDKFIDQLCKLPWPIRVNGPKPGMLRHPGNASIQFEGFSAHDILGALQPRLAASTGSACSSGIPEPSHVLRALGLSEREAESSIRFSLGQRTTEADVREAVNLIEGVLADLAGADLLQTV